MRKHYISANLKMIMLGSNKIIILEIFSFSSVIAFRESVGGVSFCSGVRHCL